MGAFALTPDKKKHKASFYGTCSFSNYPTQPLQNSLSSGGPGQTPGLCAHLGIGIPEREICLRSQSRRRSGSTRRRWC